MDYPQQKQSKILVIGETCIDRYVEGSCDRISPEAPVPILLQDLERFISLVKNIDLDYLDMLYREKFRYGTKDEIIIKLK